MEASTAIRDHVLNPTAVYSQVESWDRILGDVNTLSPDSFSWDDSSQNPQNRIDSLSPSHHPSWRIDGGDTEGTRFFAYPIFAIGRPPLRIDVYIPGQQYHEPRLRRLLRSTSVPFVSGSRIAGLEISQHVLRGLERWVARTPNFEALYHDMPFGSRVMVNEIRANMDKVEIHLVPFYDVEQNWFSVKALQQMWDLSPDHWPEVIEFTELQLHSQPHESITMVQIPSRYGKELLVFKSLVQDVKYMYHELKMLLMIEPHYNIIKSPLYVVTKKCKFGGKSGLCGFILPFYPLGSLGKALEESSLGDLEMPISLQDRFRWARQITEALLHIKNSPVGFYPDLKPDNILLEAQQGIVNAKLIDLEQRGGWYSWSPPEVRYVEYLEYIITRVECPLVRAKSLALLTSLIPDWKVPTQTDRYRNCEYGFSRAWGALQPHELEPAQVFMLGKLLWCIFEGTSSVNCGIGFDMFREQVGSKRFPDFRNTPSRLRNCIRACTAGAPEWDGRFRSIERVGTKYYPVWRIGKGADVLEQSSPDDTYEAAMKWWKVEVRCANRFVQQKVGAQEGIDRQKDDEVRSEVEIQVRQRPTLMTVLEQLQNAEAADRCLR